MSWKDLTEVQAVLNSKIPTEEDPSQYVGQVGERLDLVVTFKKRSTYEIPSYAGWGTDMVGINVFRDDAGNCFIWKSTSAFFNIAEVYSVEIPVITAWVRDDNYVHSTKEIFLGEPSLEGFLHQFRHHLQNKAREPQYKYLLVENDPKADYRIPYKDCVYRMYGEDDARAWARMVIELAS